MNFCSSEKSLYVNACKTSTRERLTAVASSKGRKHKTFNMNSWVHSNRHTYLRSWYRNWRLNFIRHKNLWNTQSEKAGHELIVVASKIEKFIPNAEIISANKLSHIQYVYNKTIMMLHHDDFTML